MKNGKGQLDKFIMQIYKAKILFKMRLKLLFPHVDKDHPKMKVGDQSTFIQAKI